MSNKQWGNSQAHQCRYSPTDARRQYPRDERKKTPQASFDRLIEELLATPEAFPNRKEPLRTYSTHISVVITDGTHAYKFKKPVDFGFVNYTTKEQRLHFCREEVKRNRRLAPQLYIGVGSVVRTDKVLRLVHKEVPDALEYAVVMKQFAQEQLFSRLLERGALSAEDFRNLAHKVAQFHLNSERVHSDMSFGTEPLIARYVFQNFTQIDELLGSRLPDQVYVIASWTEEEHRRLAPLMRERHHSGMVRMCHGDLHLGNIVKLADGSVVVFDCIEFNDELAVTDIMADTAFLWMDLAFRGAEPFAWAYLNEWLLWTGDFAGMALFRYYVVYRAMVRAKVALFQCDRAQFERYVRFAYELVSEKRTPQLVLMCGVTGSGKSTLAENLSQKMGAVWLLSDVERKRLAGLPPITRTHSAPEAGIYTVEWHRRTYERLRQLSLYLLGEGYDVIVDATFLRKDHREHFLSEAKKRGYRTTIIYSTAPEGLLRQRVEQRSHLPQTISEATIEVLQRQLASLEEPIPNEADTVLKIDTSEGLPPITTIVERLKATA